MHSVTIGCLHPMQGLHIIIIIYSHVDGQCADGASMSNELVLKIIIYYYYHRPDSYSIMTIIIVTV